jgi:single-strand DNA-binding protein
MNKAILVGNLTRDPESRSIPSGVSCATFTVACNRRYVNQQGVREADFINCVAWRQNADFVLRYMTKGTKVAVDGSIQTRTYDAQDGSKRYVTEVVVDNIELAGSRGDSRPREDNPSPPPSYGGSHQPDGFSGGAPQGASGGFTEVEDDELPF